MSEPKFPWMNQWPDIVNERVRRAFANVPRSAFLNAVQKPWAGQDAPLPIGEGQTISQPYVVALMIQAANPQPGERVLEIGTGSGFQTAILCEMTRDEQHADSELVFSIERYESLGKKAIERLAAQGYSPTVRIGDGVDGLPQHAPFNSIIVSAAAKCVPLSLWEQLVDGGRLVIPVGGQYDQQMLWLIVKNRDKPNRMRLGSVRFVPLVSRRLFGTENCLDFSNSRTQ